MNNEVIAKLFRVNNINLKEVVAFCFLFNGIGIDNFSEAIANEKR